MLNVQKPLNRVLTLMLLLLCSQGATAQDQGALLWDLSLEELAAVELSGSTFTPQTRKETPSALTIYTRQQIKQLSIRTLDELVNLVPGFQAYRQGEQGNHSTYSSRGRRTGGSGVAEILILIDGHRIAEAGNDGSANIMPRIPLSNIETVEFIRGPGSAIYGSNAMMGVINIVTSSSVNEASIGYGSFNRVTGTLLASTRIKSIAIDIFARYEKLDGDDYSLTSPATGTIDSDDPEENQDFNIKISLKDTQLQWIHSKRVAENFYVLDTLLNDYNKADSRFDSVSISHAFDWLNVGSSIALYINKTRLQIYDPVGPFLFHSDLNSEEQRLTFNNDWQVNSQASLQFGLEYRIAKATDVFVQDQFGNSFVLVEPSKQKVLGAYGQFQYAFSENTLLNVGLRYDDYSLLEDGHISPRLGLIQHINTIHTLKLLYGEAFRAPSHAELGLTNNPVIAGNPALKPETVETVELIWMAQWQNTEISLGYFENHFDDAITIVPGAIATYGNTGQDPSKGLELEFSQQLFDAWRIRGSYTHLSAKPDDAIREADNIASLSLNYASRQWNVNFLLSFHDERQMYTSVANAAPLTLPSYWLAGVKLQYSINENWLCSLTMNNLLDEEFETPAQSFSLNQGIANKGRDMELAMQWTF